MHTVGAAFMALQCIFGSKGKRSPSVECFMRAFYKSKLIKYSFPSERSGYSTGAGRCSEPRQGVFFATLASDNQTPTPPNIACSKLWQSSCTRTSVHSIQTMAVCWREVQRCSARNSLPEQEWSLTFFLRSSSAARSPPQPLLPALKACERRQDG